MQPEPRISVVIEAYNEAHAALAFHLETMDALVAQKYPYLDQVEVILIGSRKHVESWTSTPDPAWAVFHSIRGVVVEESDGGHYWVLKQRGATEARGRIIAFTDSDVTPEAGWLQVIEDRIEGGAEAVVGPSMFRSGGLGPYSIPMVVTASVSWGFVLGPADADGVERPNSLLAHNIAVRRDVLEGRANFSDEHQFSFGSSSFFRRLMEARVRVEYEPRMRAAHAMTFSWWLKTRHFRGGWETYKRWDLCDTHERQWAKAPSLVEPLLVFAARLRWQLALWWRYSRAVGYSGWKSALAFPVAVLAIVTGLGTEVLGMYAYTLAPQRTAHLARF